MAIAAVAAATVVSAGASIYASNRAGAAQTRASEEASATQQRQYDQTRADLAPWRQAGGQALDALTYGLGLGRGANPYVAGADVAANRPRSGPGPVPSSGPAYPWPAAPAGFDAEPEPYLSAADFADSHTAAGRPGYRGPTLAQLNAGIRARNAALQTPITAWTATPAPPATQGLGEFSRDFSLADFVRDPGAEFRRQQGERALTRAATARGLNLSGATLTALAGYNQGLAAQEYQAAYERWNADRAGRFNRLASVAGLGQTATNTGVAAGQRAADAVAANQLAAGGALAANYLQTGRDIGNAAGTVAGLYRGYR